MPAWLGRQAKHLTCYISTHCAQRYIAYFVGSFGIFNIFHIFAARKIMRRIRTYSAFVLLLLFSCYYCGISMLQHTHIVHGSSIVHSHLGGDAQHDHSQSQYAVIDILSEFQTEQAETVHFDATPFYRFYETSCEYNAPAYLSKVQSAHALRGPPAEA